MSPLEIELDDARRWPLVLSLCVVRDPCVLRVRPWFGLAHVAQQCPTCGASRAACRVCGQILHTCAMRAALGGGYLCDGCDDPGPLPPADRSAERPPLCVPDPRDTHTGCVRCGRPITVRDVLVRELAAVIVLASFGGGAA